VQGHSGLYSANCAVHPLLVSAAVCSILMRHGLMRDGSVDCDPWGESAFPSRA
jgi:hypothetical protein